MAQGRNINNVVANNPANPYKIKKCPHMKKNIDEKYNPDAYNVGLNCGKDAGQSIMYVHMHLISRYKGDAENPRDGIRGVIPKKKLLNESYGGMKLKWKECIIN